MPSKLSSFPSFRKLSVEIRLQIWALASSDQEPRVVAVHVKSTDGTNIAIPDGEERLPIAGTRQDNESIAYCIDPPRNLPALLHACRESREQFLKTGPYELCFQTLQRYPIYFNSQIDTVYLVCDGFHGNDAPHFIITEQLRTVKHLVVDDGSSILDAALSLQNCEHLKRLTILVGGDEDRYLGIGGFEEEREEVEERPVLESLDHVQWYYWFRREEFAGHMIILEDAEHDGWSGAGNVKLE